MNIPSILKTYLAKSGGHFKGRQVDISNSFERSVALAGIPKGKVVKPVMLKSGKAYLMAIIRSDQVVDLSVINRLFKRDFEFCRADEINALIPGCDLEALPPVPAPYELNAIMDKSILDMEHVYFASGVQGLLIRAGKDDFVKLQEKTWQSHTIVKATEGAVMDDSAKDKMRKKVQMLDELPSMPGLATELIRIRNNPYAHASELAAVIEQDPSLTAQILRYANAHEEKIDSLEQAIVRVLGMDFVLDVAFGLALGRAFNNPKEGPLGLNSFWQHSVYCAELTQELCKSIDFNKRPPAGMGYLAGLLHNFGILLLGHLFPTQFERLNRAMENNPDRSIIELERETIGVSHTELGVWLMDAWDMPKEICDAVTDHHNPTHNGDYAIYANLVYIANALLKRHGIGEGETMTIPESMMQRLGLTNEDLEAALGSVFQGREGLDFMAAKMAA